MEEILKNVLPEVKFIGIHYTKAHNSPVPILDEFQFIEEWENLIERALIIEQDTLYETGS